MRLLTYLHVSFTTTSISQPSTAASGSQLIRNCLRHSDCNIQADESIEGICSLLQCKSIKTDLSCSYFVRSRVKESSSSGDLIQRDMPAHRDCWLKVIH
ncbi:hypothetical protein MHYP_G00223030 [Metynnis hypsauchen]